MELQGGSLPVWPSRSTVNTAIFDSGAPRAERRLRTRTSTSSASARAP